MTRLKTEHILIAGAELEGKSRCRGGEFGLWPAAEAETVEVTLRIQEIT